MENNPNLSTSPARLTAPGEAETEKWAPQASETGASERSPICLFLLELGAEFNTCSGSGKPHQHHYGDGGLSRHTREVVELMLQCNKALQTGVEEHKIRLAGFFHDVGKIMDYEKIDGSWRKTPHSRMVHHIPRSALLWEKYREKSGYKDDGDQVLHAILAHHGERAHGSPVAPKTKLAWLLHLCDNMSARLDDCEKFDRYSSAPL